MSADEPQPAWGSGTEPPPATSKRPLFVAAALVLIALVAGVVWLLTRPESLAHRDPEGAAACKALAASARSHNTTIKISQLLEAGQHASLAETDSIEAAQKPLIGDTNIPDVDKLRAACEAEGVKIPAVVKDN
jgi:hypothetical protein